MTAHVRRRGRQTVMLALCSFIALASCRCKKETLSPVDVGAEGGDLDIGGADLLAPPWGRPVQAELDNGLLLHWLHEPGAPAFHLRLLFPTSNRADRLDAAGVRVAVRATEQELERRFARHDVGVEVVNQAGRVEFAFHGRADQADTIMAIVSEVLGQGRPVRRLTVAQGKVFAESQRPSASEMVGAHVVTSLLDLPREHEAVLPELVKGQSKKGLERAWWTLTDPRDAVMIVHSGNAASEAEEPLSGLAKRWRGRALIKVSPPGALDRLRLEPPKPSRTSPRPLLGENPVPMTVLSHPPVSSKAMVMIARRVPASTPEERAIARLVHRMLQEELDSRLLISGDIGLLLIRVRLSSNHPTQALKKAAERLESFAEAEDLPDRPRQAAQMWLGARIVDASLDGEDWTSLWSESLDLASNEADVRISLARDARLLLGADTGAISKWKRKWLHPREGGGGWTWAVAGANGGQLVELAKIVPLESE